MTRQFKQRFTTARPLRSSRSVTEQESLDWALESDRGRIINSAAVRRLQQKTQVFPLERNAAVRSRLTHSLEVQQTGRFIIRQIFALLGSKAADYGLDGLERPCETLVEMACLMHDIGNPPFGHFGEAAISRWFAEHAPQLDGFKQLSSDPSRSEWRDRLVSELAHFEGNAQAIRLIATLQRLNLTYLQSACILKYTRPAYEPRPKDTDPFSYLKKKPGYYLSEQPFVTALQEQLGMAAGHRFPLTYVMEAADDISYCLADLEDGVDKGLLTYAQLAELLVAEFRQQRPDDFAEGHFAGKSFSDLLAEPLRRADEETINKEHEFFVALRVALIYPLVRHAAESFIEQIDAVFDGNLNRALLEDNSPAHSIIATLKQVAVRHVFSTPEVETLELQGYRILTGVLDHYQPLLVLTREQFTALAAGKRTKLLVESRLFNRLPKKHVKAYVQLCQQSQCDDDLWELYCRCRLLQDMVSGMTDQFALDEFQTLEAKGFI
ncbi:MAG: dGTPase [Idiomarina sp.]|nr:dGTPase [Idiomarina sp.]